MRFFYIYIIFSFFSIISSSAQENEQLLFRVIDDETKQPVSYATVQFVNSKNGTIANLEGDFRIPIQYKKEKDTLVISCIGYSTKKVALNLLTNKTITIINLIPKVEQLNQVVIRSNKLQAKQIVRKAIDKIRINYPVKPFSYVGYYRDYQIVDGKYINLNESILEVFDRGFQSHKISDSLNKTALYSYKTNTEFTQDTLLSNSVYNDSKQIKYGKMGTSVNNELTLLNIHNPIRNYNSGSFSFVYIFEKNFIKNHDFFDKGFLYLDDEKLYKIEFSGKKNITGYSYKAKGFIYISKEDFSIHRFDYKLFSYNSKTPLFNVDIEYKREKDKMYLNYITFNNNFFVLNENDLKVTDAIYDNNQNAFFLTFNKSIDNKSLKKKNIKLYYKKEKIRVSKINLYKSNIIRIDIPDNFISVLDYGVKVLIGENGISYEIKNIKDITGLSINKTSKIAGYQFRELFVQRVFSNKEPDTDLLFVKKGKSLKEASVNKNNIDDYWLNSPLKTADN